MNLIHVMTSIPKIFFNLLSLCNTRVSLSVKDECQYEAHGRWYDTALLSYARYIYFPSFSIVQNLFWSFRKVHIFLWWQQFVENFSVITRRKMLKLICCKYATMPKWVRKNNNFDNIVFKENILLIALRYVVFFISFLFLIRSWSNHKTYKL